MTVPFGTVKRMPPEEAANAQPAEASDVETVTGELPGLYNSTYSSFAPLGPRRRNSLMIKVGKPPGGVTVTLNWQLAAFAPVTVTGVVPTGKVEPEGVL